jgi:O-antigen ligase
MNHIQYSALVAFAAILILYQAKLMKNGLIRYVYVLFFITMTTNLVISGGRTGYVIFFTSLVILLFVYYKFTLKNFLQILVFPVAVFYIGYYFNSDVQARIENSFKDIEKINQESNYNTSFGQRIAFYPITYDILKQDDNSFIYGVGVGDLKQELKESIERTKLINVIHPHVHSSYLTAYLNSGIFGLILFILMWYYLFNIKIRNKEMRFIALLFPLNFSIGIIVDIFFTQYPMMVYFSIFVAIILAGEKADSVAIVHTQKDKNI